LFLAFVHLTEEESDSFNVYISALYRVNRAFKSEAVPLLDEYLTMIAQVLEESRMRGEIQCDHIEAAALMVLSLTESYILSARVLELSEQTIRQQAQQVTQLILNGLGASLS
jgi:hypothetical protein